MRMEPARRCGERVRDTGKQCDLLAGHADPCETKSAWDRDGRLIVPEGLRETMNHLHEEVVKARKAYILADRRASHLFILLERYLPAGECCGKEMECGGDCFLPEKHEGPCLCAADRSGFGTCPA